MKLYRIRNTATGQYYRHKYSQFRGGDWVDERDATIWTKPGGVSGALGALREKARNGRQAATFVVETAVVNPDLLQWREKP
jgi:hypothetical protein